MKRYFGKTKKKQNNKMVKKTQYNRKLKNTGLINGGKYEKKIKIKPRNSIIIPPPSSS